MVNLSKPSTEAIATPRSRMADLVALASAIDLRGLTA